MLLLHLSTWCELSLRLRVREILDGDWEMLTKMLKNQTFSGSLNIVSNINITITIIENG
jgi:hypothetical protein